MAKAQTKKAAPAAPAEDEIVVGSKVEFLGYGEDVPEEEQVLEAGQVYEVVGLPEIVKDEDSGEDVETGYVVQAPNPDFNEKKKPHPNTNPEFLEVEVLAEEIQLAADDDESAAQGQEAEQDAEQEAEQPAKTPRGKGKASVKEQAGAAEETKAGKGKAAAGKGKAAAEAPKGKGKAAVKKAAAPAEDETKAADELPDLEGEDEAVLALINDSEDLIATAQELEQSVATTEYQLGGVLYHIKKDKAYLEVEGGEEYNETGGFQKFLLDYFNIDYRKAMYLIDIYVYFTMAQIENPSEVVAGMGWTKASKIAKFLVAEGSDVEGLIELANENTVADLSEMIKEQVQVGGTRTPGETKTRLTLKFRFFEEEAQIVEDTLAAACEQLGLKDNSEAMLHIIQEWAITNGTGAAGETEAPAKKSAGKAPGKAAAKRATAKA